MAHRFRRRQTRSSCQPSEQQPLLVAVAEVVLRILVEEEVEQELLLASEVGEEGVGYSQS